MFALGQIKIGERLRLNALGRVNQKNRSFNRGEGPRDLVIEINMSRSINQIQRKLIIFQRRNGRLIKHLNRLHLDRDSPLALNIHLIQKLFFHLPLLNRSRKFKKPIGQR
ncbi:MAG: hypothetical protein UX51_C0033G0003 [Candidatus Azambacteria bacterium GW2011_GWF2_46_32]|uniref:Uncharacterized protein n=1 Tax=Candidatus Azambacteria bacterium GW2011_GWF2_46_32 TaxID=1618628 RepID=A0A0G1PX09_9BACT|nr:MAG: hypothetical protein UX51_C0033G0003 [Candidatus Azambacteria bacterium GW2011_GWF2_46_32]